MTAYLHDAVPTEFVEADGIRFAYRRFGAKSGVPLVFFQHLMGNLDDHDSALTTRGPDWTIVQPSSLDSCESDNARDDWQSRSCAVTGR